MLSKFTEDCNLTAARRSDWLSEVHGLCARCRTMAI